jgi:hypothetical protein
MQTDTISRVGKEQKRDIDMLRGSQEDVDEFLEALEEEKKLETVPESVEL